MPRAAQWGSRVRSTGTVLGNRLLVLDVARHGSLVVLRRWSAQTETPETDRRNVYKDHFEPECLYGAIEVVGQRHAPQFAQRRMVGTVVSGARGRDTAGRRGFHVHTGEDVALCTTAMASNTVRPTEIRHATQLVHAPSAPSHAPDQSHRMASPVRRSFAGDVVAANLSRSLSTVRRTKVSDMSTRPL